MLLRDVGRLSNASHMMRLSCSSYLLYVLLLTVCYFIVTAPSTPNTSNYIGEFTAIGCHYGAVYSVSFGNGMIVLLFPFLVLVFEVHGWSYIYVFHVPCNNVE